MEEKVKRSRGRPPKIKPVKVAIKAPVQKDALLSLVQQKFMDAYGFETTEAQSKQFLLSLVAQIEL
tara:strand:- start:482 stop:679 length:198 start_codon:yes stop_codon:yes gene_type:complete